MTTKFGKIIKKIRIDNDELLGDMASKIGVSTAFLSKVENGLSKPSDKVVNQIIFKYGIQGIEKEKLEEAAAEQQNGYLINFSGLNAKEKRLTIQFAQELPNMNTENIRAIQNILKSCGKEEGE